MVPQGSQDGSQVVTQGKSTRTQPDSEDRMAGHKSTGEASRVLAKVMWGTATTSNSDAVGKTNTLPAAQGPPSHRLNTSSASTLDMVRPEVNAAEALSLHAG